VAVHAQLRAVLIAAVAIPASIISTFTLMRGMDFSLNNMTLLALTLAVGIVIDDAIIVLENIFRFMEEKGKDRRSAAIEATREIGLAVMATTLSLVIIFLPIAFMNGYARKYVNSFGWTMAMAILVSLLVAFHAYADDEFAAAASNGERQKISRYRIIHAAEEIYLRMLRWSLAHRGVILVICLATFLSTFGLYQLVGAIGFPSDDQGELISSFTIPEGTSWRKPRSKPAKWLRKSWRFQKWLSCRAFTHGPTNHAHFFIVLVPRGERRKSHEQVATVVRGHSLEISKHHLQCATALLSLEVNVFPHWCCDSRAGT